MRNHKEVEPPTDITLKEQEEKSVRIMKEYTLLTPLFGGGAEPTEYDPVTIIRATEIRGHLRFWWRACRGAKYKTFEELKEAEDTIWGKAHKKGDKNPLDYHQTVQVSVESPNENPKEQKWPNQETPFKIVKKLDKGRYESSPDRSTNIHPYAAFPLKPSQDELNKVPLTSSKPDAPPVYTNIRFTLTLVYLKKYQDDINAALWAWETFGGVGARTRRGFGALSPSKLSLGDTPETKDSKNVQEPLDLPLSTSESDVKTWMDTHLEKHVISGKPPKGVPYLSKQVRICIATTSKDARIAWSDLIEKLKSFRQDSYGRPRQEISRDRFRYGRSYWPEAEAIRDITRLRNRNKHKPLGHPQKFPRAVFGLPIEFHFPGEIPDRQSPTLQNAMESSDRLASPIILRPLACLKDGFIGLAVLLDGFTLPPEGVILKEKDEKSKKRPNKEEKKRETQLTKDDLKKLPKLNLKKTDVLQAFMDYLEGK